MYEILSVGLKAITWSLFFQVKRMKQIDVTLESKKTVQMKHKL